MSVPGTVYFIQAGDDGPIKIGVAADPEHRRQMLQTGSHQELVLLAAIPGTMRMARVVEQKLHAMFASGRLRGEWFDAATPGLKRAISRAIQAEASVAVPPNEGGLD